MNEHRVVPAEVLDVQTTASDPLVSAWVAARRDCRRVEPTR